MHFLFCQLERLRAESAAAEETAKLKKDLEKSMEEAREWALKAEMCRLKAEKEAKQQSHRLSEQLAEMQKKQETEVRGTICEFPIKWYLLAVLLKQGTWLVAQCFSWRINKMHCFIFSHLIVVVLLILLATASECCPPSRVGFLQENKRRITGQASIDDLRNTAAKEHCEGGV